MDQSKKASSLSTTRLSPLAKPFTLNRSTTHQPSSSSSLLSPQEPSFSSLTHCNDDPFSSLLDSFRNSNLRSKLGTAPAEPALPSAEASNKEKSLFEQYPSQEFGKNLDFDKFRWSHFEVLKEFPVPTCSPSLTGLGYGTGINGNEESCRKEQGVEFHESLIGKGNDDVGSSFDDSSMLQMGKHAVDCSNPSLAVSDGIFEKSTGTIWGKDILSTLKGTTHAADELSSFLESNHKFTPLKLSTDTLSAKNAPQNQSSENLGDNDLDEDSPCWKGTMASRVTPSETSGSVQFHHVEKATEKHNSLNPLAPHFFPGAGYIKDDPVSSKSSTSIATNLFSGEDLLMKTAVTESPLELNGGIELQHSTDICGREKHFTMLNDPKSSFADRMLNSSCMMAHYSSNVDCSTSKGKVVTIVDADGFVKGTKGPRANRPKSGVFPASDCSLTPISTSTSSPTRVGVGADLFSTVKGFSKSLVDSPKPDVQVMISTMLVLSELLVQTCVDGVESYNGPDSDMIRQIINNLNDFSSKKVEHRIPTLYSTHADSRYHLDSSSELSQGPEVSTKETLTASHQLYVKSDKIGKKYSAPDVLNERGQISFVSSSHQGTEKGNEFAQLQLIRRSLGKSVEFDKQMQPEAFLFWNLWLESEAERCYRKFKTFRCLMDAGIDVDSADVAELLR